MKEKKKRTPSAKRPTSKFWFFTCHTSHVPEKDVQAALQASYESGKLVYCVYNLERAPETGRVHLQGHAILHRSYDRGAAQRILGIGKSDCEITKDLDGAEQYCRKEATRIEGTEPWSIGKIVKSRQGERTDITGAIECIKEGGGLDDLIDNFGEEYVKYHRGLEKVLVREQLKRKRGEERHVELIIYWGKTGLGKSRRAGYEFPDAYYLNIYGGATSVWWDGYDGEEVVVIDEFKGGCTREDLLKFTDPYPKTRSYPTKGGTVVPKYTKIVITSNWHPSQWYKPSIFEDGKYEGSALERRVNQGTIVHFTEEWVPPEDINSE